MTTNITNTTPGKNEKQKPTVLVDVSQSSRENGRTPIPVILDRHKDSLESRWSELVHEKKNIEGELANYSKTAFAARQLKVRKENYGVCKTDSIAAWINEKARMEKERQALVSKKIAIEQQMMEIKPRLKITRQEDDWIEKHTHLELLRSIVYELREIKEILQHGAMKKAHQG